MRVIGFSWIWDFPNSLGLGPDIGYCKINFTDTYMETFWKLQYINIQFDQPKRFENIFRFKIFLWSLNVINNLLLENMNLSQCSVSGKFIVINQNS